MYAYDILTKLNKCNHYYYIMDVIGYVYSSTIHV